MGRASGVAGDLAAGQGQEVDVRGGDVLVALGQESRDMRLRLVRLERLPVAVQLVEHALVSRAVDLVAGIDDRAWLVVSDALASLGYELVEGVRLYLVPGLGSKRLDRLSVREVQTWMTGLRNACQCCAQGKDAGRPTERRRCCAVGHCCRQVPSPRTIRDLRTVLRSALSTAQREELVTKNAAALVTVPSGRTRKTQAWTSDEARAFLESARADDDPHYALYVLVLVLGLRKGETLGLSWRDVDLDAGELAIRWQVQRVRRELLRRETKTEGSDATLPLPALCVTALRLRADQQGSDREAAGAAWQGDAEALVFTGRFGMPVDPRTVNRVFTARCAKAAVRRITVHDARRTCGSLLADLDVHPRVAMEILRHADFSVTMEIYTKVSSQQTRDALKRLGESLT
jgi:integrase